MTNHWHPALLYISSDTQVLLLMIMKTQENKENAIAFYRMSYEGDPRKATELYVGSEYIQHNPLVGDGIEPFIKYFERMQSEYPESSAHNNRMY